MCSPSSEDAGGEVGERHGRGRRRRAHRACRGEARARVRGETGRVSAPRAVPSRDDARQNGIPHSDATVRKTLVFLSAARPVPAGDARVDLARTFMGGFVSVPASAGAFPGSVSEGDISGAFLRLNRPRESTKRFSLRFSCAGVNLETENALARASDARSSAYRPARPTHKVHSGAACVSECVATTLRVAHVLRARLPDFAKLSEWRARGAEIVTDGIGAIRPIDPLVDGLRVAPVWKLPDASETAGRSRVTSAYAHRAPRELFRARTREPAHERRGASRASGIASDSRVPSSRCQPPKTRST